MTPFVKLVTKILGIGFVIIGAAGFFVDQYLLIFEVDMIHNIVHLVSGIVALAASGRYQTARLFLIVFGLVYGVVTVVGFVNNGTILGLFEVNDADNLLHLAIAAACLTVGFGSSRSV